MIAIRSNFFYTRTVPCELWHFDRAKSADRKDRVLMLDARNVYRKVTRKIYDFSPEQQSNLAAIVWLYRGQQDRFVKLVQGYVERLAVEAEAIAPTLTRFETALTASRAPLASFTESIADLKEIPQEKRQPIADAMIEWTNAASAYANDRAGLLTGLAAFSKHLTKTSPVTNPTQHQARKAFDLQAEAARGIIKQVDLLYKLATRAAQLAQELAADDAAAEYLDRRAAGKLIKRLEEDRKAAVEQIKAATYFHRQIAWLQDRFPNAEMQDVPGLCKVASRAEVEAADWSLTPGRYVGVAPAEVDEDFDFEQVLRDIHVELADLNREAAQLAAKIQETFEELGV